MSKGGISLKATVYQMNEVSLFRLYLLRALYLLIIVGHGIVVWPGVIHHEKPWELMQGVVACMLVAFSALSVLGLRYPLQMLPLLLWEDGQRRPRPSLTSRMWD